MTVSSGWWKRYALNQTFAINHRFQSEKILRCTSHPAIVFNSRQGPSWEKCKRLHTFNQFQYYTSWYASNRCKGMWLSSPITKMNCLFKKNKTPHCVQLFLISSKVRQLIIFLQPKKVKNNLHWKGYTRSVFTEDIGKEYWKQNHEWIFCKINASATFKSSILPKHCKDYNLLSAQRHCVTILIRNIKMLQYLSSALSSTYP